LEVRWPSHVEPINAAEIHSIRSAIFGKYLSASEKRLAAIMFADQLLPDARPALGRAFLDPQKRIWAARFEPPPVLRHETVWYVFDSGGSPLGRLRLPRERRVQLAAVQGDRVLLIPRDSLDVQSVEVWRLRMQ
jgi:hypothetical protein